jgi:hypothetical protein
MQIMVLREISGICAFPFVLLIKFIGKTVLLFKTATVPSRETLPATLTTNENPTAINSYSYCRIIFRPYNNR